MKILFSLILFFISQNLYSQNKFSDTTRKIPFDTNVIKNQTRLSNTSDVFSYDSLYIWNDKRSLSEIMDERPGYFIFDMGLGERNDINYNGRYSSETGIFRDGIQINDNFYQGFDRQNISVNEIDKIEEISDVSSFFYGINTFSKSINIISKDIFQPRPFSQLRFSQDRFGSLFADFIFSQPFSRKTNVQLGITNHSADGRYDNSDYNIWSGRGRVNFFLSPKFNAKLNFYLNNFKRGLNDGLIYSPVAGNLENDEAPVINPNANEHLENYYYDMTLTGRFFKNKNSLTKLIMYSNNSLRNIFNPDDSTYFSDIYPEAYSHSIIYGLDVSQNLSILNNKNISSDFLVGGNIYLNFFDGNFFNKFQNNYYSLKGKYDFSYKTFFISAFARYDLLGGESYGSGGTEAGLKLIQFKDFAFEINGGFSQTNYLIPNKIRNVFRSSVQEIIYVPRNFYEAGIALNFKGFKLSGEVYKSTTDYYGSPYGVNSNLTWISKYTDITVSYNYSNDKMFPENYIKSDLAYKGILFRGKLNIKTGFNLKYYNIKNIIDQSQIRYSIVYPYPYENIFPQQNQFIADFYIGARIGKANINLTIANILNSLVYNAYVFPLDNRGGLLNSISRFTIVWDFIN